MKGFKTIAFNAVMLIAGVVGADQFTPEMVNELVEAFLVVWAGGNALLRAVTSSPIFKKEG